jgi:hypothetical protein
LSSNTSVNLKPLNRNVKLVSGERACLKSSCCGSLFVALFVLFQLWALTYITVALALETFDLFLSGAFCDVFDVQTFLIIAILSPS